MGVVSLLVTDGRHTVGTTNRPHLEFGIYLGRPFLYHVSRNLMTRGSWLVPILARQTMAAHGQHQATLAKEHDLISTRKNKSSH